MSEGLGRAGGRLMPGRRVSEEPGRAGLPGRRRVERGPRGGELSETGDPSSCSPEGDDASGGGQGPPLISAGRERNTGQLKGGRGGCGDGSGLGWPAGDPAGRLAGVKMAPAWRLNLRGRGFRIKPLISWRRAGGGSLGNQGVSLGAVTPNGVTQFPTLERRGLG